MIFLANFCPHHTGECAAADRASGHSIVVLVSMQVLLFQLWASSESTYKRAAGKADMLPMLAQETGCLGCWAGNDVWSWMLGCANELRQDFWWFAKKEGNA